MTLEQRRDKFIGNAIKVHGDRYDYNLSYINYINNTTQIEIFCKKCDKTFKQTPKKHTVCKKGCKECGNNNRRLGNDEFIKRAIPIHNGSYDYSLVNYINAHTEVVIICEIHGEFKQTPDLHLNTKGCKKCFPIYKRDVDEFTKLASDIHNNSDNKLDYSNVEYVNNYTSVEIICSEHGVFTQTPKNHINKKYGCPKCSVKSKGELEIRKQLSLNELKHIEQKKFNDCVYKSKLKFDFYIPKHNVVIEYDGIQHFESIEFFGGEEGLNETKLRDKIKDKYCKDNNIKLLRIPYWDFKNIEKIIKKELCL